ncbi:polysaccharide lyase [Halomonas sp. AOP42-B2-16]|uniref:polysaccharide lyase n=2 Tax=unclassified Halomonas TaxID=2609666 RepID=UPI00403456C2
MARYWIPALTLGLLLMIWWLPNEKDEPPKGSQQIETFDSAQLSRTGKTIVEHSRTHLAPHQGIEGSTAVRVDYEGYERGSRRVVVSPRITPAEQYELSFWVEFCEGFDFGRGGKLHGLGPADPVAGGNDIPPEGWSARLMFRGDGGLQTYVYHQDMLGKYGDTAVAPDFTFQPGQYHHVVMRAALNTPAEEPNGFIKVWVDDELLIEHSTLRFRDRLTPESDIQRLMFNTFHGGSSPEWAPRTAEGSYKTDCAFFDNMALTSAFER